MTSVARTNTKQILTLDRRHTRKGDRHNVTLIKQVCTIIIFTWAIKSSVVLLRQNTKTQQLKKNKFPLSTLIRSQLRIITCVLILTTAKVSLGMFELFLLELLFIFIFKRLINCAICAPFKRLALSKKIALSRGVVLFLGTKDGGEDTFFRPRRNN
jgi:hypothetical protein